MIPITENKPQRTQTQINHQTTERTEGALILKTKSECLINTPCPLWLSLALALLVAIVYPSGSGAIEAQDTHFFINSLEGHIQINESPNRVKWQKPEKVVDYLLLKKGDKVADVGAGTGYFTVRLSKRVGDEGRVYSVDIEKRLLKYLEDRAEKEGLHNITTVLAKPDDPLLPADYFDTIFICNSYFFFGNREDYISLLKKALKKGGKLAIVDYQMNSTIQRPPPQFRVAKEKVLETMLKAGLRLEADFNFLPQQYYLVFTK